MKGNDKLLVWLSKNYLNMVDKVHTTSTTEPLPLIIEAKAEETKSADTTLSIGSIVHELIEKWLKKEKFTLPKNKVHLECFMKFQKFWKKSS